MTHDLLDIQNILPHRDPFLFVDWVKEFFPGERIVAEKKLEPDEWFFKGHFPGKPLMPGVLVSEALAQASGLLLGLTWKEESGQTEAVKPDLFLASTNIKYLNPAMPGEVLQLDAVLKKELGSMFLFDVRADVGEKQVAKGSLALAGAKNGERSA